MPRVRVIKVPAEVPSQQTDTAPKEEEIVPASAEPEVIVSSQKVAPVPDDINAQVKSTPSRGGIVISRRMLITLIALFAIVCLLFLVANKKELTPETSPKSTGSSVQNEAERLHSFVSQAVDVPANQIPSVITVSDAAKSASTNPQLFRNAQDGDKVLLYTKQVATEKSVIYILYRPSTQKIITAIEVANNTEQKNTN